MNLDRLDDALRDFQEAITNNPTDPVAFQARYLIGQCHLERDEIGQAEASWRKILDSRDLTPTAIEWRTALYSLGKLLYHTADQARRTLKPETAASQELNHDQQAALAVRFDDAILRLEEFRDRYPNATETVEVRFLLAQALQKSAEFPAIRWKSAETDDARNEFRRQMQERLERAIRELQQLQTLLQAALGAGQLDEAGQGMLRNCFFETANCLFLLGRYDAAIAAYSTSAGTKFCLATSPISALPITARRICRSPSFKRPSPRPFHATRARVPRASQAGRFLHRLRKFRGRSRLPSSFPRYCFAPSKVLHERSRFRTAITAALNRKSWKSPRTR
jgi:tetratricopeptide (TPR) repeat protein